MNNQTDIPPEQITVLEQYKAIVEGRFVKLSIDDLEHVKTLAEELKTAEQEDKGKLEKINSLESKIEELRIKADALKSQLNQKLLYLRQNPTTVKPIKTVNHTVKEEYAGITESAILEVLRANPGAGNSLIAEKLQLDNSKGIQNKIYSTVKKLQADNKLSEDRRVI